MAQRTGGLGLILCILVLAGLPAEAARAEAVVLSASQTTVPAGNDADVSISIRGAKNVGGVQFEMVYDPKVAEPKTNKVARGALAGEARVDSSVLAPGRVHLGLASTKAINGDGVVCSLPFAAVGGAGQSTALTLEAARVSELKTGSEQTVTVASGKLTIAAAAAGAGGASYVPEWVWATGGAVAVLLLLALVVYPERKAKVG